METLGISLDLEGNYKEKPRVHLKLILSLISLRKSMSCKGIKQHFLNLGCSDSSEGQARESMPGRENSCGWHLIILLLIQQLSLSTPFRARDFKNIQLKHDLGSKFMPKYICELGIFEVFYMFLRKSHSTSNFYTLSTFTLCMLWHL